MEEPPGIDIGGAKCGPTTQSSGGTAAEESAALCWAAGFREQPPQAALDPDRMCDLLLHHGLAGRFLAQLAGDYLPGWCTPTLHQAMGAEQVAALALLERQREALRELNTALSPEQHPLIPLPGSEPYALTASSADPGPTRVDVVSPAPGRLRTVLEALGYRVLFGNEGYDELIRLHRDGVAINVYGSFPIYTYPAALQDLDLTPESHPGIWLQTFPSPERHEISFRDLTALLSDGAGPDAPEIQVIRPEPTALILCARQFHAFIQSPFSLVLPVRLARLAEIRELLALPEFNGNLFRGLAQRWGGEDAVSLAERLLEQVGGKIPGSSRGHGDGASRATFPRCMGSSGAWVDLGPPVETLLAPSPTAALERLGMSFVRLERADGPWGRGPIPPAPGGLERFIVHAGGGDFDLPAICAWRSTDEVSFAIRLARLPRPGQEYRVDFDGESWEEHFSVEFDSIRQEPLVAGSGRVDVASDAQGHELQIHLSWPSHSTLLRGGAPARALLTITRRNHPVSSGFNAEAVIAVPLRLTLAP